MNIHMVEPTDPAERALAIRICRVNAYLDPDTATRIDPELGNLLWNQLPELAYSKWIWMWNHGRAEWDPTYSVPGENV
jgi:hypothetical protein